MERTENMTRAAAPATTLDGSYIDWAAVSGGAVVAVAVGSVLTGFGAALGLSTISAEAGEGSFNVMVIVSAVWIVATLVGSYAAGGYIAGRMRRRMDQADAEEVTARDGINGLVAWGLGMVVSVFLLGAAVSATVSAVGEAASAAGSVAETVATTTEMIVGTAPEGAVTAAGVPGLNADAPDPMAYVSDSLLRPAQVAAGTADAGAIGRSAAAILGNVSLTGEVTDAERAYLVSAVLASSGGTQPEAAARVDAAIAGAQQRRTAALQQAAETRAEAQRLMQETRDAAIVAAEAARISAILTAFILAAAAMVAAAASYVGAVRGGRHRDEGRIFSGFAYRG